MSEKLIQKRQSLGLTKVDLDKLCGFRTGTVSKLETGYLKLSPQIKEKLAKAFGMTYEELCLYLEPPESEGMMILRHIISHIPEDRIIDAAMMLSEWKRKALGGNDGKP